MAPRFYLKGTEGKKVYFSTADYLDINSNVTFTVSSTGLTSTIPPELVVKYPNGGQTISKDNSVIIKWKTYGKVELINVDYFAGTKPDVNIDEGWTSIAKDTKNVDSLSWTPSSTEGINSMAEGLRDSIRIRIKSSDGKIRDMSGWYFKISHGGGSEVSSKNAITEFIWDGPVKK